MVIQHLSTRLIKQNICFDLPHRRSTTVSLETRNPFPISDFYFPRTELATYCPRLPIFWSVVYLARIVYVLLSTKRSYKAYGVAGPICKFIYLYIFFSVLWLA